VFHGPHDPAFDQVMPFLSGNRFFFPALLVAGCIFLWKGRLRAFICAVMLAVILPSWIIFKIFMRSSVVGIFCSSYPSDNQRLPDIYFHLFIIFIHLYEKRLFRGYLFQCDDHLVQQKLGDLATQCEVSRLLCYRVAWLQSRGVPISYESSQSYLFGSELVRHFAKTAMEIMSLIKGLNETKGATAIMVTHDQRLANQAKRTVMMLDGSIVQETVN
jgi:hypothetical protein